MASEPSKQPGKRPATPAASSSPPAQTPPAVPKSPPLFRPIDWLSMALTSLLVFIGYLYTLSPDLTLQDSGELAVGSFYAGVPHPPGYPVWTMYSWLFTRIIPFSNVAFRVGISSAVAGALTCGLIALMVSRGSSMFVESVADFKTLDRRVENWICLVAGFVSGMLIGFNGFMWSQSIIVEVYPFSMLSMTAVLCFLLRWMYAPHQHRYLLIAWFLCGITFNNHQSLLVITVAMVVMSAFVQAKMGREFFFWSALAYLAGCYLEYKHEISLLEGNPPVVFIFHLIGVGLIIGWIYLAIKTKVRGIELLRNFIVLPIVGGALGLVVLMTTVDTFMRWILAMLSTGLGAISLAVFVGGVVAYIAVRPHTLPLGRQWIAALRSGVMFLLGAAFYLYMPLTSMTNPPLNWGYPRTVGGFVHAFTRGQYERIHPTWGGGTNPVSFVTSLVSTYSKQVWYILIQGPLEEFNVAYLALGFIPLFFFKRLQPRERAWLLGLTAFYFVLGPFLLYLFNPAPDRQALQLNKPFFIASHVIIAMAIGYGITLLLVSLATASEKIRLPVIALLFGLSGVGLFNLVKTFSESSPVLTRVIALGALVLAIGMLALLARTMMQTSAAPPNNGYKHTRMAVLALFIALCGLAVFDVARTHDLFQYSVLRMTAVSGLVLAGFATIVIAISFNRALMTPLLVIGLLLPIYPMLGHWSDNEQRGHLFGYWFGHDMFTPPFKDKTGKLSYNKKDREELLKTPEGQKTIYPEMARDTVLFGGTDHGRFCPTYMIFCESFIPAKDKPHDPEFNRRDVYLITQNALADGTYLQYIRAHYNRSTEPDHPFFGELLRSDKERELNFKTNLLAKLIASPLDSFFMGHGYKVEAERRARGVYPPVEIHTPSNEESQRCFQEYMNDAQARMQKGQLRPGEDVRVVDNRVQVSGQVAVMAINALLAKVIFDSNPTNEFYVEESFPLEWMYPHLTPFGIIMKINRQPLPELTQDIVDKDHQFWSDYSERLIGNWITYDTPISNICAFAEKVYVNKNYEGFKGDRRFVRDDDGQKAFSKLRSSIAGVYAWRVANQTAGRVMQIEARLQANPQMQLTPEEKNVMEVHNRMFREAEFAFKQAYAFCPYSPEALYRYVQLLAGARRFDDAILLAKTSHDLDPENAGLANLAVELQKMKAGAGPSAAAQSGAAMAQAEANFRANPTDLQNAATLAQMYAGQGRTADVLHIADSMVTNPKADPNMISFAAQVYQQLADYPKLEKALARWVQLTPTPEAWLDYAAAQAVQKKNSEAIASLRQALAMSAARLQTNSKAENLAKSLPADARFASIKDTPEFQQLLATNK